jgi:Protein of unknown function (DUF2637)
VARKSDDRQGPEGAHASREAGHSGEGRTQAPDAPASSRPRRDAGRVLRVVALIAVVAAGLAGLTAAACVLSYSSIHGLAIQAGVHGRLASIYPYIFDAMLVVAGCSVLALRGAGLVSRIYSWLCLLVLLAALAGGGAIRAAAVTVPAKLAGVIAAIVPWALVLIGFGLLLALLRYARLRRLGKRNGGASGPALPDPAAASSALTGPAAVSPAAGAPTVINAPVSERDREQEPVPQRALIPGLAQRPQVISAREPAHAGQPASGAGAQPTGAGAGAMAGLAAATAVPLTKDAQPAPGDAQAPGPTRAADAGEPTDAKGTEEARQPAAQDPAGSGSGAQTAAAPRRAQQGAEPPTLPGATVPAQPSSRQEATQAAGSETDEPAQPAAPRPETNAQARPGVRRAEMQLRARIPKQPAQQAASPGWPTPFVPRVGQQGGQAPEAGSPPASAGPSGAGEPASGAPAAQAQASGLLPKRIPGQQPGIAGRDDATITQTPADAGEAPGQADASTDGGTTAGGVSGEQAGPQDDRPSAATTLNPAPTLDADDDEPGRLPAFRRARSSPVPPQGDDPQAHDPQGDDPQGDDPPGDEARS